MAFLDQQPQQPRPTAPPKGAVPARPAAAPPAAAPKKTIAEMKAAAFQKAETIVGELEQSLINLSSADFVRRLHVNAINAIRKAKGDDMLLALTTVDGQNSFKQAVMESAEMGLQINDIEGCLVVYKPKNGPIIIKFQPMWQGMVEKAYTTGVVKAFHRDCYREKDDFEWNMGRLAYHRIDFRCKDRGPVVGYWVRAVLESGETVDEFKTVAEIDKVRAASNCPNSPAWRDWYDEMAYKTVFRSLCKRLPKTEALIKIIANWDRDFNFDERTPAPDSPSMPRKNAFMSAVQAQAEVVEAETVPEQEPGQPTVETPVDGGANV